MNTLQPPATDFNNLSHVDLVFLDQIQRLRRRLRKSRRATRVQTQKIKFLIEDREEAQRDRDVARENAEWWQARCRGFSQVKFEMAQVVK